MLICSMTTSLDGCAEAVEGDLGTGTGDLAGHTSSVTSCAASAPPRRPTDPRDDRPSDRPSTATRPAAAHLRLTRGWQTRGSDRGRDDARSTSSGRFQERADPRSRRSSPGER